VTLLAVPNVSEGRDRTAVAAIAEAFSGGDEPVVVGADEVAQDRAQDCGRQRPRERVRLLDTHSDADHHRTVFTLAGPPAALGDALLRGASAALGRIALDRRGRAELGQHPHVGAVDVVPIVYLDRGTRGAAHAEALVVADRIGAELGVPVFLYGALADGRSRAELRRGGLVGLSERIALGELRPDYGPRRPQPGAGATLVAARAPLVAFNLQLAAPASIEDARRIAGLIREGGAEGLPGLRAIGVTLRDPLTNRPTKAADLRPRTVAGSAGPVAQVSMNVERPLEVSLAEVVMAVRRHAEIASAELVGLAPRAALEGFPEDVPLVGFDPARHVIERALGTDDAHSGPHASP
jgi:glutamate formiminotransferase / 5-formyltetrahydrofolate cyclo-ligase